MPIEIPYAARQAIANPDALKVLSTVDPDGQPHATPIADLDFDESGRLRYLERAEYSVSNRNLVNAIWFAREASILVHGSHDNSWLVRAKPWKAIIAGPVFEERYRALRAREGDVPLSTVWLFDVLDITDQSPVAKEERESRGRLELIHLDRIARKEGGRS